MKSGFVTSLKMLVQIDYNLMSPFKFYTPFLCGRNISHAGSDVIFLKRNTPIRKLLDLMDQKYRVRFGYLSVIQFFSAKLLYLY